MAKKLGKYGRSVSIIGVGCTPFQNTLDIPEVCGITEGELYARAALDAMKDAGVESKDIDAYFHGQIGSALNSQYYTPAVQMMNWIGMHGKPAIHHDEGCCTGYVALDLAVNAVASGKHDIVLSGGIEMANSIALPNKPAHMRRKITTEEIVVFLDQLFDRAYLSRNFLAGTHMVMDNFASAYCARYGLTDDQMDDVLNSLCINLRRSAAQHPLAQFRTEFDIIAKEAGFNTAQEYMKSDYNPKISNYLRLQQLESRTEGAAAVIVCPTEMAKSFNQQPIEVLGIGASTMEGNTTDLEEKATEEAVRQVYELTGLTGKNIDLLFACDFIVASNLLAGEATGYLPRGEGWQYILDGQTAFDGEKPINPNGGRAYFGHAYAASGCADYYEAVMQMRGLCGDRKVKKLPEHTLIRGFGGGQNVTAAILRTVQ